MSEVSTSFKSPVNRVINEKPLDVIAIDHLPSLIPRESSIEFSKQLLPHLMTLKNLDFKKKQDTEEKRVWERARNLFLEKVKEL